MISNVEFLHGYSTSVLGDIRQRLGAEDEDCTSCDERINEMDARALTKEWCGWNLGDEEWGSQIIDMYEALKAER